MNATGKNHAYLLTPPGTGAIALFRVEGPAAVDVASRVFRDARGRAIPAGQWEIGRLRYGHIVDANDDILDDVVACMIRQTPNAAVEISCHGGVRVVERILALLDGYGVTLSAAADAPDAAWPVDSAIDQEIVRQLCASKTARAVQFLAAQRMMLVPEIRLLAATFSSRPDDATRGLHDLLSGYPAAQLLLNGANVAIIGPPNSGKSTLFNRLMGRTAVVVSPVAGTTRDWVTGDIEVFGFPLRLIDTAGTHETVDSLERTAIGAGAQIASAADATILLLDGSVPLHAAHVRAWISRWRQLASEAPPCAGREPAAIPPMVVAVNKVDTHPVDTSALAASVHLPPSAVVTTAANIGTGVDRLVEAVLRSLGVAECWNDRNPCLFTTRQARLVREFLSLPPPEADAEWLERMVIGTRSSCGTRN